MQQHGILKYPEGTACAEVLKAGASDESRAMASDAAKAEWARANEGETGAAANSGAKTIFTGFGIGLLYTTLMKSFFAWKEVPSKVFGAPFRAGSVAIEASPELLGVGYIIGPRIAADHGGGRRARLPRADSDDHLFRRSASTDRLCRREPSRFAR